MNSKNPDKVFGKIKTDINKLARNNTIPDYFIAVCGSTPQPNTRDAIATYALSKGISHANTWTGSEFWEEIVKHKALYTRLMAGEPYPEIAAHIRRFGRTSLIPSGCRVLVVSDKDVSHANYLAKALKDENGFDLDHVDTLMLWPDYSFVKLEQKLSSQHYHVVIITFYDTPPSDHSSHLSPYPHPLFDDVVRNLKIQRHSLWICAPDMVSSATEISAEHKGAFDHFVIQPNNDRNNSAPNPQNMIMDHVYQYVKRVSFTPI